MELGISLYIFGTILFFTGTTLFSFYNYSHHLFSLASKETKFGATAQKKYKNLANKTKKGAFWYWLFFVYGLLLTVTGILVLYFALVNK